MKRNAIFRLIAWSVTLVILLSLLTIGMTRLNPFRFFAQETSVTAEPVKDGATAEFSDDIRDIEIDWMAGEIRIQPADVNQIQVSETAVADSRYAMVCRQEGNTLKIKYCQRNTLGTLKHGACSKDLLIQVPTDWVVRSLEVDAASAKLSAQNLTAQEVDVNTASGECSFLDCTVDKLDVDTASGDVYYAGSLRKMECESASAGIRAELTNVPSRIKIDTASGALDMTLPKDAGFYAKLDTMSGTFSSDFPTVQKNNRYVCGDGSCEISMNSMSGSVAIHMGD